METIAAITTAKGIAAISSIELLGPDSQGIIHSIFEPVSAKKYEFIPGSIHLGTVVNGDAVVDHVVLGCLAANDFEINCHGNPLIVEKVMKLLADRGVKPVSAEQLLITKLQNDSSKKHNRN